MAVQTRLHRCWRHAVLILVLLAPRAQAGLQPIDPMQFFIAPDRAAVLAWKIDPGDSNRKLGFAITDYWGRNVTASETEVSGDGRVEVSVSLKQGYYEIAFAPNDERFGICVLPERTGLADRFFGMDSAMSWLELRGDVRDAMARILNRIGVSISRERLTWGEVHSGKERWDWQTEHGYETLRQTSARHGVKTLELFHDAPGWMGATDANRYPSDLVAAASSWAQIGQRWRPHWDALEIWNEPDIFFGSDLPGDQYVPVAKAIAYGLRDVSPAVPLVGGVFTGGCPDAYRRSCALNGLLEDVDTISFHTYDKADSVQKMVQTYRDWLRAANVESMPLWITESGRPWKKGQGRPPADQDVESALDITMKGIEARACGVAAYFAFISVYYEENTNNFGMMGKEVTPLRSMAAYAQAITALAGKPYRGDLATTDPAIQRARVFGDAGQSVVVLYTGQAKSGATVKLDLPFSRLEGIDGRVLSAADGGSVPIPDGLTYLWIDSAKIGNALRSDTQAVRLYAVSRRPQPHRGRPSAIVLQHRFDPRQMTAATVGYTVTPEAARHFALRVRVHNLKDQSERIELTLTTPTGPAQGGAAPPRAVDVPPTGSADAAWELDLRRLADRQGACTLMVQGKSKNMERIGTLAIDVSIKQEAASTQP